MLYELGRPKLCDDVNQLKLVEENFDDFLQMAKDISFLFHFSYYGFHLGEKIQKALRYNLLPIQRNWVRTVLRDPVIQGCTDWITLDTLSALVHDSYKLIAQIKFTHVCLQLRICRAMFGGLEEFCYMKL